MRADEVYAILKKKIESQKYESQVTGVKGEAEEKFRTGNVNISKKDIGLENVENVTVDDMSPSFEEAGERENISSGDKLPTLFGKIAKWFTDLKKIAFTAAYSDLTGAPDSLKNPETLTFTGGATESYDGSEAVSVEIPQIPESLKNPEALSFTGAQTTSYDGSEAVEIEIPTIPESLKNPESLTLKFNGDVQESYDGSIAREYDISPSAIGAAESEHTHLYAGSDTAGGSAKSAVKLDAPDAGSATKPVYFSDGRPVECDYELKKTVPEDAVFTDTNTTYDPYAGDAAGLVPQRDARDTTTKYLREDGTWQVPPDTKYTALKNPNKITFTGGATGDYDGSEEKTITIPPAVSVKGSAEESYRTGEVNITAENIGLGKVDNTSDVQKHVASADTANKVAHVLTFAGDIEESYDGSAEKTVTINKAALGLDKVENKTAKEIRAGMTKEEIVKSLGYTPEAPLKKMEQELVAGNWKGESFPYTYEIQIPGLTATQYVYVHSGEDLTLDQIEAFSDACITGKKQEAGKITLKAVEKPGINLPVMIELGGEPDAES